jgi:hypothetical protein
VCFFTLLALVFEQVNAMHKDVGGSSLTPPNTNHFEQETNLEIGNTASSSPSSSPAVGEEERTTTLTSGRITTTTTSTSENIASTIAATYD